MKLESSLSFPVVSCVPLRSEGELREISVSATRQKTSSLHEESALAGSSECQEILTYCLQQLMKNPGRTLLDAPLCSDSGGNCYGHKYCMWLSRRGIGSLHHSVFVCCITCQAPSNPDQSRGEITSKQTRQAPQSPDVALCSGGPLLWADFSKLCHVVVHGQGLTEPY